MAVVDMAWPADQHGGTVSAGVRFEMFIYVDDVDAAIEELGGYSIVLREPADMPWGERVAYVSDPDDNPVALATATSPGESQERNQRHCPSLISRRSIWVARLTRSRCRQSRSSHSTSSACSPELSEVCSGSAARSARAAPAGPASSTAGVCVVTRRHHRLRIAVSRAGSRRSSGSEIHGQDRPT